MSVSRDNNRAKFIERISRKSLAKRFDKSSQRTTATHLVESPRSIKERLFLKTADCFYDWIPVLTRLLDLGF